MKTFIATLLVLAATTCYAEEKKEIKIQINPTEILQITCSDTGLTLLQKEELGQSGCCSYHSGVCGCSGGRVVCCDDTYSPSCSCKTNDKPIKKNNENPRAPL